jgi:hypothetical protein
MTSAKRTSPCGRAGRRVRRRPRAGPRGGRARGGSQGASWCLARPAACCQASGACLQLRGSRRARSQQQRRQQRLRLRRLRGFSGGPTCSDSEPQPSTVTVPPVMVAPARKYEADEASPSTYASPGDLYVWPEGIWRAGVGGWGPGGQRGGREAAGWRLLGLPQSPLAIC